MKVRKVLKWFGILAGGALGLVVIAVAVVYVIIGRDLSKSFEVDWPQANLATQQVDLVEAQRITQTRGCFGCHGENVAGKVFFEVFDGTRLIAPDLARSAKNYSTAQMDNIIRHGIRPDGSSVLGIMPSEMYQHLSDEDAGMIIAYLQSLTPAQERLQDTRFGPVSRMMLLMFKRANGTILAVEAVDHGAAGLMVSPSDPGSLGEYLAMTSCSECHGGDLGGVTDGAFITPPLTIVQAYSLEDFKTLMRTGVPLGGRELDLMAMVAVNRFAHFTDEEIAVLHAYLSGLSVPQT